MRQKTWTIIGLLLSMWGVSAPRAWAFGGLIGRSSKSYMLNLCEYYALYDTRVAQINRGMIPTEARVEVKILPANCSFPTSQDLQATEGVETRIYTRYIVELVELRQAIDRALDQFKAKADSLNLKCTPEKHIFVTLVFHQVDTGNTIEMSPIDLKSTGRQFIWDAQGRPISLIEHGSLLKSTFEATSPEERCKSVTQMSPRIYKKKSN